jgi:hypothetical protein
MTAGPARRRAVAARGRDVAGHRHGVAARGQGVAARDRAVVERQLGRAPHPMSRVVARCPFGLPAAVEDLPHDGRGRPFPTLFYVTCSTLAEALSRLEDGGGVRRWSAAVQRDAGLAASLRDAERYERRRRRLLARRCEAAPLDGGASLALGVGGVRPGAAGLKCLHAHVAHALAREGYRLGRLILEEAGYPWCRDERCRLPDAWADDRSRDADPSGDARRREVGS